MKNIKITQASKKDGERLVRFFKHYRNKDLIQNRIDCYLSHNFSVIAKDDKKIAGILQWYVKENPNDGVVEFEEVYVLDNYREKGIGSLLIGFAIQSVKDYFRGLNIKPRKIFLFVDKENKKARELYKKHGFQLVSSVGGLFSNKKTELFYCLDLRNTNTGC